MKRFAFLFSLLSLCLITACDTSATSDSNTTSEQLDSTIINQEETAEPVKPALKRNQNIAFEETLNQNGISFTISSPNVPERNTMVIFSTGMETLNDTFQIEVEGMIHAAQLADINGDSYPEVYVFSKEKDNDQKGEVYIFTSYRNRSYGQAFFKEVPRANALAPSTTTTDRFKLEGGKLVREVGMTVEGNAAQAAPATSNIIYELRPGEASYQLIPLQQSN